NENARQFYERFGFVRSDKAQTDAYDGKELKELMYIYQME
ncbi:MAG: GNAT family N-acetyltransferase, partial [Lachnospiraceae bacterium]|nr:GNAT family N-acetyltransferase [Lachnospiraceae bacterium]